MYLAPVYCSVFRDKELEMPDMCAVAQANLFNALE